MTLPLPAMWYADVDYLRGTIRRGQDAGLESALVRSFERIAGTTVGGSYSWEPWSIMGCRGQRLGACAYAFGPAVGYVCQASGMAARPLYDNRLPFDNIARLDVQVTVWYERDRPTIAAAAAAASSYARNGARGRPWRVQLRQGYGDGDTCYLGTRGKKSKFLRVYDKWREADKSEAWQYAWRLEAELTDHHAREAHGTLLDLGVSRETVAAVVAGYFLERGVSMPSLEGVRPLDASQLPKDEGNIERRLRWLETQVAPAIDKLIGLGVSCSRIENALGVRVSDYQGSRDDASRV